MKSYVITGATSDIGQALINSIIANEKDFFIFAQGCKDLDKLENIIEKYSQYIKLFDYDLSQPLQVNSFVEILQKECQLPTHFIHLPALPVVNTKYKKFDESYFRRDMEIQIYSAVTICKNLFPKMVKNKFGRVLFIQTSYTIGTPPQNVSSYVMVKSAIGGLVKSLAVEYAKYGITVNCVAPSMIETNFLKNTPDLIIEAAAKANPMGRNAKPDDIIPAMIFLLSEEARYITGVTLPITGGSIIA